MDELGVDDAFIQVYGCDATLEIYSCLAPADARQRHDVIGNFPSRRRED
jgi:hypothetical protein